MTLLFYITLRELGQPRLLTLTVPLVYVLLPHYSTDRFWIAAFQANLSIALYFLSLYADLRVLQAQAARMWTWKLLSIACLLGSTLAYEVVLPLFLLNVVLVWYRARKLHGQEGAGRGRPKIWANASTLLVINLLYAAHTKIRI